MTARKDTQLAIRRREAREIRKAQAATPLTYVVPPIHALLSDVQVVVGHELKALLAKQDGGGSIGTEGARQLKDLTSALIASAQAEREIVDTDLGELSDEELALRLQAELDGLQAAKKESGNND
jgi:hypothetical protein